MVAPALTRSWNLTQLIRASCQTSRETETSGGGGKGGSDLHPVKCTRPGSLWLLIKLEGQEILGLA